MITAIANIGKYVAGDNVKQDKFLRLICKKLDE